MGVKNVVTLITAVLECLLFSGLLFGWASIRYPLEKECYFWDHCVNAEAEEDSTVPYRDDGMTTVVVYATTETQYINATIGHAETTTSDTLAARATSTAKSMTTAFLTRTKCDKTCKPQAEKLTLVFTIASTILSLSTLLNGYIYDKFGTWVSRAIAISLLTIGGILMSISTAESSWMLFPSLSCFAVGGILLMVTNLQIGNLFGKLRSSVITMLSGALDSSSFMFLFFKIMYDTGISLSTIFQVTCWCTLLLWARTFFLLPRYHIPFYPAVDYDYGIKDCGFFKKKPSDEEMVAMRVEKDDSENDISRETDETKQPNFVDCLKMSIYWTNVAHFSLLQLRNYFFMSSLNDWLKVLAGGEEEMVPYLVAFGTCQLFGIVFAPLNGLLVDTITRFLKKSGRNGACEDTVPLKAAMCSGVATTLLGTVFSVVIVIPSLPLQYVSFILQVIFRSFLYGGSMSFIAIAFPGRHFGKLYGITMTIGGLVSLLQYPIFTAVLQGFDGDFLPVNIIFTFVSISTLLHPLNVWLYCKRQDRIHLSKIVKEHEPLQG